VLLFRVNLVLVVDICDLRNAFVCCPFLLAAISTRLLASSAPLRINESEMSAVISEREIALIAPVSNESETTVSGTLYVDLLDPKDAVVASSKTTEHLNPVAV